MKAGRIPLDAVHGAARLAPEQIARLGPGAAIEFAGRTVPFVPLARLLDGSFPTVRRAWSAVIVGSGTRLAALGVDRLQGTASVVTRPLPELLPASPLVAGVSLDAEGRPRLVLDAEGLIDAALGADDAEPERPAGKAPRPPVLIVDDSLTTRMLEQSILESAGYEVELANSAEEALETARRNRYSLFLVDVEMPGMDGFGFVEQTRADPTLRDIPAILVTSRNAAEDRQRGRDAGASGYIVKSEFDQAELLSLIRPLIG
jgi:two-component system chemotaxis sensor kinase CheA